MEDRQVRQQAEGVGHAELAAAWFLLAAGFALRLFYVFRYGVESDETQHLHVCWGWANGLVQYRDVFDNHTPLFHMLCAPLAALFGERADLLVLMRLAMLPLVAFSLWCVYAIGRNVFSRRAGMWAAAVVGVLPPFFSCTVEFRADTLWAAGWLAALLALTGGRLTARRCLAAGLMLGVTLAASIKTPFLGAGLLAAAIGTALICRRRDLSNVRPTRVAAGWFVAGVALVPAALMACFWALGALPAFYDGVVVHNLTPGMFTMSQGEWHARCREALLPLACVPAAIVMARFCGEDKPVVQRVFLVLLAGFLLPLANLLPIVESQHLLPFWPILILVIAAAAEWAVGKFSVAGDFGERGRTVSLATRRCNGRGAASFGVLAVVTASAMLAIVAAGAPRRDKMRDHTLVCRDVLTMTDRGQTVMDLKGELVLRPRAWYYVLERVTRQRIRLGWIADDIAEQLVRTRTCVASAKAERLPQAAAAFVRENYILVGRLLVAGKRLTPASPGGTVGFSVAIPVQYAVATPAGPARGMLDGRAYVGPVELSAGPHQYQPADGETDLVLVWGRAIERGFSPFARAAE